MLVGMSLWWPVSRRPGSLPGGWLGAAEGAMTGRGRAGLGIAVGGGEGALGGFGVVAGTTGEGGLVAGCDLEGSGLGGRWGLGGGVGARRTVALVAEVGAVVA